MGDGLERQPWERAKLARERDAADASLRKTVWGDWRRARIQFLMGFGAHPRPEATRIADGELKLLQSKR